MSKDVVCISFQSILMVVIREELHKQQIMETRMWNTLGIPASTWSKFRNMRMKLDMDRFFRICDYLHVAPSTIMRKVENSFLPLSINHGWAVINSIPESYVKEDLLQEWYDHFRKLRGESYHIDQEEREYFNSPTLVNFETPYFFIWLSKQLASS